MRIVIDIEGAEVSARVEHPGGEDPPTELLRRAKALGAMSAGAAPAEPGAARGFAGTPAAAVARMLEPAKAGAAPVEAAGAARKAKSRGAPSARKKRKSR